MKHFNFAMVLLITGMLIGGFGMAQLLPNPTITDKQAYYEKIFDTKENETLVFNEKMETEAIRTTPISKTDLVYELDAKVLEITKTVSLSATKTMDKKFYLIDFEIASNYKEIKTIVIK